MSKMPTIDYVEIHVPPAPVMPSACLSGGCGSASADPRLRPAPPSFGAVSVNGVIIKPEAIARELQHHPAPDGERAWQAAARALALRELLLQEARCLGIKPEPETDETGRRETEEDALVRALLAQQLKPTAVGTEQCRRYYHGHIERFRTPALFEASHILIEPTADNHAAWATAKAEACAIVTAIGDDAQAFAAAAREFSKCPTAQQNGSLGQVRRGELVASVQAALEALPEGTTGREPIRSRFGWHILRRQRTIDGQTLPFELVEAKIAEMLEARAWAVSALRYVTELAQSAAVEGVMIDPSTVANGLG